MSPDLSAPTCHPRRRHVADGLCGSCLLIVKRGHVPTVLLPCTCWPDYSTPDAPSLDPNPNCERHAQEIGLREEIAALHTGEAPF